MARPVRRGVGGGKGEEGGKGERETYRLAWPIFRLHPVNSP